MQQSFCTSWLLVLLMLVLAACSGTSSETAPVEAPSSTESDETVTNSIDLAESYIGDNELVSASLRVDYPTGWIAQGTGTQVLLASQNPDTITAESHAIVVNIMPIEGEMLADYPERSPSAIIEQAILGITSENVDVTSVTLNGRNAATATTSFDGNAAIVYAIQFSDNAFIILTAINGQAFSEGDAAIIAQITQQIEYDAGAIPQSE